MKDTVSFHFLLVYDVYYYFQIKEMERIVVGFVFFFFFFGILDFLSLCKKSRDWELFVHQDQGE